MRRVDGLVDETKKLGGNMNLDEYKRRVETMHSVTGVPTYWEELQNAIAERDKWREIARELYTWLLPSDEDDSVREAGLEAYAMYDEAVRGE